MSCPQGFHPQNHVLTSHSSKSFLISYTETQLLVLSQILRCSRYFFSLLRYVPGSTTYVANVSEHSPECRLMTSILSSFERMAAVIRFVSEDIFVVMKTCGEYRWHGKSLLSPRMSIIASSCRSASELNFELFEDYFLASPEPIG